ncbi:DUF2267 domain-containing protein [Streptomyces sp. ISL-10]|uniref:DUF2267 domain-containing protein n=1 Tax=Streptomyces sp. ISL-10 TaxID=2819172 RepID=UPI001BEB46CB|nr:DUF2267 domain-containing protein [Streptomyces sp. ISL-10]MBT2365671.1 DUF2267 domain-containing protein [Streptomyces sp. ISL-10]
MITHADLTQAVARRAGLADADEAVRVTRVVLGTLAHRLPMPQRRRLRAALPGPEQDAAYATVPAAADDVTGLLAEAGRHLDTPPERALLLARAVVSQIAEAEPGLAGSCGSTFRMITRRCSRRRRSTPSACMRRPTHARR